ncbi:MAG: ABC transporter substrate-binding protein [Verrucomicrobia bacterium]|nr:ABC transporter substrate-binding protein [Verrucomicrobiota bacterium]
MKPPFRISVVRMLGFAVLASLLSPPAFGAGVTVRFVGEPKAWSGAVEPWYQAVTEEWAKKTGNKLEYIGRPDDYSAVLPLYQQQWASKSPDVDIYQIDVVWQGMAAPHAVDLKKYYNEDELKAYFPRIIENNTVGGKLVSIPLYTDAGILYYRTDLLEKYGYKEPPKTWEELAAMAKKIQDGERAAGNSEFQGFVFEGKASESLTCNALEWIRSNGGGSVIEPDKRVSINNPNAIKALDTAHSWIGTISPAQITTYDEEGARKIWQAGNAAFMRNWPYAYGLGADPKSSAISGKFDITVLPKGGDNGSNAACLGGHQLMISAYSKAPDAAADLVRYLSSAGVQKKRAIDWSLLPTRPALYNDPDVLAKYPFFKTMLDVLNDAVTRPSTVTGADYNQLSTAFSQNVNKVLTGAESSKDAVVEVERVAKGMVH